MVYHYLKPVVDCFVAALLLILLLPLLIIVYLSIKIFSPGPAFYRQTRVGYKETEFDLLKFRTMVVDDQRDLGKELSADDPGITPVGRILRRFKFDELPQLINVLRGEMSLVGPRPPLPLLLQDMDEHTRRRFSVRPGLTGLAQVNGNVHMSWRKRWEYDLQYARRVTALGDLRILLKTLLVILFGEKRFLKE